MAEGASRKMRNISKFEDRSRRALAALVDRDEVRTGSRMVAYENVARTIGTSTSWIAKFLRGDAAVREPRITLYQNIIAAYDALCGRVERQNRAEEDRLRTLRGELHAPASGDQTSTDR